MYILNPRQEKSMKKIILFIIFMSALFPIFVVPAMADMKSTNYTIKTSVISSGGNDMGSGNYDARSTLGQSSPVKSMASDHFRLKSGFWHTMTQGGCIWDFEPDSDVDGADLQMFIQGTGPGGYGTSELQSFTNEFGRTDCFN